jgi:hypothetical protein
VEQNVSRALSLVQRAYVLDPAHGRLRPALGPGAKYSRAPAMDRAALGYWAARFRGR